MKASNEQFDMSPSVRQVGAGDNTAPSIPSAVFMEDLRDNKWCPDANKNVSVINRTTEKHIFQFYCRWALSWRSISERNPEKDAFIHSWVSLNKEQVNWIVNQQSLVGANEKWLRQSRTVINDAESLFQYCQQTEKKNSSGLALAKETNLTFSDEINAQSRISKMKKRQSDLWEIGTHDLDGKLRSIDYISPHGRSENKIFRRLKSLTNPEKIKLCAGVTVFEVFNYFIIADDIYWSTRYVLINETSQIQTPHLQQ